MAPAYEVFVTHEATQDGAGAAITAPTRCAFCRDDPARTRKTWTFYIDNPITSLNRHVVNTAAGHAYRKERTTWAWHLEIQKRRLHIPDATSQRRVVIERYWGSRYRPLDYDNLVGGCKPLLDAMVTAKLLTSDDVAGVIAHYLQVDIMTLDVCPVGANTFVGISISELAP